MRKICGKEKEVYEILQKERNVLAINLALKLGFTNQDFYSKHRVRVLIKGLREKFNENLDNQENPWIYEENENIKKLLWIGREKNGYTLRENIPVRTFEAKERKEMATGTIRNGSSIYSFLKKKNNKLYRNIKLTVVGQMKEILK